jgi:hypothetical protein
MENHTRQVGMILNGADIRGCFSKSFGPLRLIETESLTPSGDIMKAYALMCQLPFGYAISLSVQHNN